MLKQTEKSIQDSVIQLFKAHGLYIQRINTGLATNYHTGNFMRLADKGHSDLVACDRQNKLVFIEVKSGTGKLSVEQVAFLREQNRKGRRWLIAVSYEDAVKFLEDESYHGEAKHVSEVLDESSRFVPSKTTGKRMAMNTVLEFDKFMRKKE